MPYSNKQQQIINARKEAKLCVTCGINPIAMNKLGTKLMTRCHDCGMVHRMRMKKYGKGDKDKLVRKVFSSLVDPNDPPVPLPEKMKPQLPTKPPQGATRQEIEDFYLKPPEKEPEPRGPAANRLQIECMDTAMLSRYEEIAKGTMQHAD